MRNNPVAWFEIYVQDMSRAKTFYEGVFDTKLRKLDADGIDIWMFDMDGTAFGASGALIRFDGMPSGGNSTLVYFRCEDCAVESARVEVLGGKVQRPKMSIGEWGFVALVLDTEGNLFGLHSMK